MPKLPSGVSIVTESALSLIFKDGPRGQFLCLTKDQDGNAKICAVDNNTGDAWTEDFNSLTAAHVRPGQIVLDVSMNWNGTGLCGDADFPAVSSIVDAITPVPGGVGAVTSAVLMAHTVRAAEYLTGEGGA